jgi:enoyl-CoA hydratase/carnithine racemase
MELGEFANSHIVASADDGVLKIVLNRPEKRNAVNAAMYDALANLLAHAKDSHSTGAVAILAAGSDFCAGTDLAELRAGSGSIPFEERPVGRFLKELVWFDKPLVAGVRGRAIGFGFTLLLHCDVLFVAKDAALSAPFARLGFAPEAASSRLLPARVGYRNAFDIFARNTVLMGSEAERFGLATAVLDPDEVDAAALAEAAVLSAQPWESVRSIKRLITSPEETWATIGREMKEFEELKARRNDGSFANSASQP